MKFEEFNSQLGDDCGASSEKLNVIYNESDTRCWTAIVRSGKDNIFVTYHVNKEEYGNRGFDILAGRQMKFMVPSSEVFGELNQILGN